MTCPYCSVAECDSDDHVFPRFLGGRATVRVCESCNSTFGYTIEGATSRHLQSFILLLRRTGMKTPKPITWKSVDLGDGLGPHHIDQDFKAIPSRPTIQRDSTGSIIHATGSAQHLRQILKSMAKSGRSGKIAQSDPITIDLPRVRLQLPVADDIKRLAVKMTLASALRADRSLALDQRSHGYLLTGYVDDVCPVRIDINEYREIDDRRPLAGHAVYVRASSSDHRAYSIVQFFSAIQLFCELTNDYVGDDFAVLAFHDPTTHAEQFELVSPIDYPLPARIIGGTPNQRFGERFERMRKELESVYGDQAPEWFRPVEDHGGQPNEG